MHPLFHGRRELPCVFVGHIKPVKVRIGKAKCTLDHIVEGIQREIIRHENVAADGIPLHPAVPMHNLLLFLRKICSKLKMKPDHLPGFIRKLLSIYFFKIQRVPVIQRTREFPKVQHLIRCQVFFRSQCFPCFFPAISRQVYSRGFQYRSDEACILSCLLKGYPLPAGIRLCKGQPAVQVLFPVVSHIPVPSFLPVSSVPSAIFRSFCTHASLSRARLWL